MRLSLASNVGQIVISRLRSSSIGCRAGRVDGHFGDGSLGADSQVGI